jgi:GNAT superfamily N-acetyltransferase
MQVAVVTQSDIAPVADTLARAFFHDPVWGWVFPDEEERVSQLDATWRLLLEGGVGYRWAWTTRGFEAATLWIPPGLPELAEPYDARLEPLLIGLIGDRIDLVMEMFCRFDASHPRHTDHCYLSLLGTRPDHRGQGIGMASLTANLAAVDLEHRAAYLESTNPVNIPRYRAVGFEICGSFDLPAGGPTVTTMWRDPR